MTEIQEMIAMMRDEGDKGALLMFFLPGGEGSPERALTHLREVIIPLVPDEVLGGDDFAGFHITLNHDKGCPAQESKDFHDCSCEWLTCEAIVINDLQSGLIQATGIYDGELEYEEEDAKPRVLYRKEDTPEDEPPAV